MPSSTFIDISAGITSRLPIWPGSPGWSRVVRQDVACGDSVTESALNIDMHCGTHVDAPSHHLIDGATVDQLRLDAFIGPVTVIQVGDVETIGVDDLQAAPHSVERLLLRTNNSDAKLLDNPQFMGSYVALTVEAATYLAQLPNLVLVGIDYLSIQPFQGNDETHKVLMRNNIALLEGLDLRNAPVGESRLLALPLSIPGSEAAPVRAVLEVETA